jgi:hypothetical protein
MLQQMTLEWIKRTEFIIFSPQTGQQIEQIWLV